MYRSSKPISLTVIKKGCLLQHFCRKEHRLTMLIENLRSILGHWNHPLLQRDSNLGHRNKNTKLARLGNLGHVYVNMAV